MKKFAILSLLLSSVSFAFCYPTFDQFADASASGGSLYLAGSPLGRTDAPNVGGQTNMNGDIWFGINTSSIQARILFESPIAILPTAVFPLDFRHLRVKRRC